MIWRLNAVAVALGLLAVLTMSHGKKSRGGKPREGEEITVADILGWRVVAWDLIDNKLKGRDQPCSLDDQISGIAKTAHDVVTIPAAQLVQTYKQFPREEIQQTVGLFTGKAVESLCSLKDELVCVDAVCVDCEGASSEVKEQKKLIVDVCGYGKGVKETDRDNVEPKKKKKEKESRGERSHVSLLLVGLTCVCVEILRSVFVM